MKRCGAQIPISRANGADKQANLLFLLKDGLAPILALTVAVLLGITAFHFGHGLGPDPATNVTHSRAPVPQVRHEL
jgi:hypothetical protein